jgi:hypothetical protein
MGCLTTINLVTHPRICALLRAFIGDNRGAIVGGGNQQDKYWNGIGKMGRTLNTKEYGFNGESKEDENVFKEEILTIIVMADLSKEGKMNGIVM